MILAPLTLLVLLLAGCATREVPLIFRNPGTAASCALTTEGDALVVTCLCKE